MIFPLFVAHAPRHRASIIIATMEEIMATKQPDQGWREWVLGSLPKNSMTEHATGGGFTPPPAADGPLNFGGFHSAPSSIAARCQASGSFANRCLWRTDCAAAHSALDIKRIEKTVDFRLQREQCCFATARMRGIRFLEAKDGVE